MVKRLSTVREIRVQSLGREDPLEKAMANHSSILAWKMSWMEEPVAESWTRLSNFTSLLLSDVLLSFFTLILTLFEFFFEEVLYSQGPKFKKYRRVQ